MKAVVTVTAEEQEGVKLLGCYGVFFTVILKKYHIDSSFGQDEEEKKNQQDRQCNKDGDWSPGVAVPRLPERMPGCTGQLAVLPVGWSGAAIVAHGLFTFLSPVTTYKAGDLGDVQVAIAFMAICNRFLGSISQIAQSNWRGLELCHGIGVLEQCAV